MNNGSGRSNDEISFIVHHIKIMISELIEKSLSGIERRKELVWFGGIIKNLGPAEISELSGFSREHGEIVRQALVAYDDYGVKLLEMSIKLKTDCPKDIIEFIEARPQLTLQVLKGKLP